MRRIVGPVALFPLVLLVGCGPTTDEAGSDLPVATSSTTQGPATSEAAAGGEAAEPPTTTAEAPTTTPPAPPSSTVPPSTTPPRPQPCGEIHYAPNTDSGAWEIMATGVDCDRARELVEHMREHPIGVGETVLGFQCVGEATGDILNSLQVACDDGTGSVTWRET